MWWNIILMWLMALVFGYVGYNLKEFYIGKSKNKRQPCKDWICRIPDNCNTECPQCEIRKRKECESCLFYGECEEATR